MFRVGVVADSHYKATSRFEECIRLHNWIADDLAERQVCAVIHTGDVYDAKSTPEEREAVADWTQRVTKFAPMLFIRGNHDALDDMLILARLETKCPVIVEQEAGLHNVGGLWVAAMAWPRKGALLAASDAESAEHGEAAASDALRAILRGLGAQLTQLPGPHLFAAHAMVRGSMTSTGQPLVGCDMEVGLEDLALVGASAYALGHIHKGQKWTIDGAPVIYPGSPRRTAFGEVEPKGYTLLEFADDGTLVSDTFVEAPATRMVQIECDYHGEAVTLPGGETVAVGLSLSDEDRAAAIGAEVRLRYRVASDFRTAAAEEAAQIRDGLIAAGAVLVKIEPVVRVETRTQVSQVAKATTLAEKMRAYWDSKGFDPGARRVPLMSKLSDIEETSRASA
jgi:exonuclease SbcD